MSMVVYDFMEDDVTEYQTGKYVVRAEDLPRANNLP